MPQEQQGTGFTNLSQFLNANQNNNLGNAVTSNLNNQVSGINNNLNSLYGNFQNSANQNALGTQAQQTANTGALNQILGGSTSVSQAQSNQFQQALGGQYQGPTSLNSGAVSQLSTKAGNLNNELSNINTTPGLQNLLTSTITQPNYTQGEQTLDATLLGQNQRGLQQSKASAAGLGQAIQQKQNAAQAIGQQNVNQAQDYAQQLNNQLSGASASIDTAVQNQLASQSTQQALGVGQVLNSNGTINANTLQDLGLTQDQLAQLNVTGLTPQQILQYISPEALNTGTAVTPQQIAQYNALAQLSNKPVTDITQIPTTGPTGTLQPGQLFSVNSQAINQAGQQQQDALRAQLGTLNQQIQSAQNGPGIRNLNTSSGLGAYNSNLQNLLAQQQQLQQQLNTNGLLTPEQQQANQQQSQQNKAALGSLFTAGQNGQNILSTLSGLGLNNTAQQLVGLNAPNAQITPQQQIALLQSTLQQAQTPGFGNNLTQQAAQNSANLGGTNLGNTALTQQNIAALPAEIQSAIAALQQINNGNIGSPVQGAPIARF